MRTGTPAIRGRRSGVLVLQGPSGCFVASGVRGEERGVAPKEFHPVRNPTLLYIETPLYKNCTEMIRRTTGRSLPNHASAQGR